MNDVQLDRETLQNRWQELSDEILRLGQVIVSRLDGTPHMRDYGTKRRAEYERDLANYHAETEALRQERNRIAIRRNAIRKQILALDGKLPPFGV